MQNDESNTTAQAVCDAIEATLWAKAKERAWLKYQEAECFESDGRANGFSKGFDAGRACCPITADQWNNLLGERDHLRSQLHEIFHVWTTQSEACADNSAVGEKMAQIARIALKL